MSGIDAVWQELEACESRLAGVQASCLDRWRGPAALAAASTIALEAQRLRTLREQVVDLGGTLREAVSSPPSPQRDGAFAARVAALAGGEAGPPADPAAWWQALSPAERAELLASRPAMLGSLDGLPAAVRDQANRALLASWLQQPDAPAALRALAERLRREPGALLLALDQRGHAALALGDPDRARDVCVYVPGVGTTLAGLAGSGTDRIRALADRLAQLSPGGGHSAIVWLGYDPPPAPGADPAA
ncbi:alpha/beta hydrolase, partial [Streptacidiphilus monticola]